MWRRFELIHALTYFTPEARAAYEAAGLRGYWRGYFAGRAAPIPGLAAGDPSRVALEGYPGMVARALPSVWSLANPD